MYIAILICTHIAVCIGSNTLDNQLFTKDARIMEATTFWITTIVWIILSGDIYWESKCKDNEDH